MNILQLSGKNLKKVTVLDIEAIVFDTTSSNTGLDKGLAGLLIEARITEWRKQNREGTVPDLVIKGCEDHILNLMSRDFERAVLAGAAPQLIMGEKHQATDIVQLLVGKVRRLGRSFRHFMLTKFTITKFTVPRISDTRLVDLFLSSSVHILFHCFSQNTTDFHGETLVPSLFGNIYISLSCLL